MPPPYPCRLPTLGSSGAGTRPKAHALRHTHGSTCPHGCRACVPRLRHHALITPAAHWAGTRRRWNVRGPAAGSRTTRWPWGRWSCPHARQAGCCSGTFARSTAACQTTRAEVSRMHPARHATTSKCRTLLVARCPLSAPPALVLRSAARCACGAVDRLGARPPRCDAGEPHQRARRAACRGGGARRSACIDREAAG